MVCPAFNAPLYGSVILPCYESFGSTCGRKCSSGYYMEGEAISKCDVKNNVTFWTPNNFTCISKSDIFMNFIIWSEWTLIDDKVFLKLWSKLSLFISIYLESTPCQPNPCLHNSKCSPIGEKMYDCDCGDRNYKGKECEKIVATVNSIPQGEVGQKLKVVFNAKPDNHIIIHVHSEDKDIVIDPKEFSIVYPNTKSEIFITATKPGKYKFDYKISGKDSPITIPPKQSFVYISPSKPLLKLINITSDFYDKTCQSFQLMSMNCQSGNKLKYESSCKDIRKGGIATITTRNGKKLPVAPIPIPGADLYQTSNYTNFSSRLEEYFIDNKIHTCSNSCPKYSSLTDEINYLNRYGYFQRAVISTISSMLVDGIDLEITERNDLSPDSMNVHIGNGDNLGKIYNSLQLKKDGYYVLYKIKFSIKLRILNEEIEFSHIDNPGVIVYDMWQGNVYLYPLDGSTFIKTDLVNKIQDIQFDVCKLKSMYFEEKRIMLGVDAKLNYGKIKLEINGAFGISEDTTSFHIKEVLKIFKKIF